MLLWRGLRDHHVRSLNIKIFQKEWVMVLTYKHCAFYRRGECEKLGMYNGFYHPCACTKKCGSYKVKKMYEHLLKTQ